MLLISQNFYKLSIQNWTIFGWVRQIKPLLHRNVLRNKRNITQPILLTMKCTFLMSVWALAPHCAYIQTLPKMLYFQGQRKSGCKGCKCIHKFWGFIGICYNAPNFNDAIGKYFTFFEDLHPSILNPYAGPDFHLNLLILVFVFIVKLRPHLW